MDKYEIVSVKEEVIEKVRIGDICVTVSVIAFKEEKTITGKLDFDYSEYEYEGDILMSEEIGDLIDEIAKQLRVFDEKCYAIGCKSFCINFTRENDDKNDYLFDSKQIKTLLQAAVKVLNFKDGFEKGRSCERC